MAVETGNGGLSPGGRFERMEAALTRIELKLDTKVGDDEFQPLVRRVELLESGETPLGKVLLEQFTRTQSQVSDLVLHGSQNAQEAGRRIAGVETKVAGLEKAQEGQATLSDDRRERDSRSLKIIALLVSAISMLSIVTSTVELLTRVH